MIVGDGVPEGKVINQQVRQIDIVPTILELRGIECPAGIHGRSLVPMMNGQTMEELPAYMESGSKLPDRFRKNPKLNWKPNSRHSDISRKRAT